MIGEITRGISKALYEGFGYRIYDEEIRQDFTGPCFYISCLQPSFQRYIGGRYLRKNPFVIHYFPASDTGYMSECHDVSERMFRVLEIIGVGDEGLIYGKDMRAEIEDGVLLFFVNYDSFSIEQPYTEPMESLRTNTAVRR